jgi:hypothetical protein
MDKPMQKFVTPPQPSSFAPPIRKSELFDPRKGHCSTCGATSGQECVSRETNLPMGNKVHTMRANPESRAFYMQ